MTQIGKSDHRYRSPPDRPEPLGSQGSEVGANFTPDEIVFMLAMDEYKRTRHRPFPSWHEVLRVLKSLGYRKVMAAEALPRLPSQRGPRPDQPAE